MNRALTRTTAALLLGCYVLSVTVSGLFHAHSPGGCAPACSGHDHGHAPACCGHDEHAAAEDVAAEDVAAVSGANVCPVCDFLAQKPIPTATIVDVVRASLYQSLVRVKPLARIEEPLSPHWTRGPPSLA